MMCCRYRSQYDGFPRRQTADQYKISAQIHSPPPILVEIVRLSTRFQAHKIVTACKIVPIAWYQHTPKQRAREPAHFNIDRRNCIRGNARRRTAPTDLVQSRRSARATVQGEMHVVRLSVSFVDLLRAPDGCEKQISQFTPLFQCYAAQSLQEQSIFRRKGNPLGTHCKLGWFWNVKGRCSPDRSTSVSFSRLYFASLG